MIVVRGYLVGGIEPPPCSVFAHNTYHNIHFHLARKSKGGKSVGATYSARVMLHITYFILDNSEKAKVRAGYGELDHGFSIIL